MDNTASRGKVVGLGGVFFKSPDTARLNAWYAQNLGLASGPDGVCFRWRKIDNPSEEGMTVWSTFKQESKYFDPSTAPFMLNYIVDDLDAILAKLEANGAVVDPKRENHEYGRFGWVFDPDGNKIELWEPPQATA